MAHDEPSDDRNINKAKRGWDSAIDFGEASNTYKLVKALLSQADRIDDDIEGVYHQHHIDTAEGDALDQFGKLVNTPRNSGEPDSKYRTRLKAEFAQSRTKTDFNDFVEFVGAVLGVDADNITFSTNYEIKPATVTVSADSELYNDIQLTAEEIREVFGGAVPAGHEVEALEKGTFRLKSDDDFDDPDKGLTSDSIETGGTLAADLEE